MIEKRHFDTAPPEDQLWILVAKYRIGGTEAVEKAGFSFYGMFKCDIGGCKCEFSNIIDYTCHHFNGKHGSLNREDGFTKMVSGFYTTHERVKEKLYREQSLRQETF